MRFLAWFGDVVDNSRGLLIGRILELDVRYCLVRLRYVGDGIFIVSAGLLHTLHTYGIQCTWAITIYGFILRVSYKPNIVSLKRR